MQIQYVSSIKEQYSVAEEGYVHTKLFVVFPVIVEAVEAELRIDNQICSN